MSQPNAPTRDGSSNGATRATGSTGSSGSNSRGWTLNPRPLRDASAAPTPNRRGADRLPSPPRRRRWGLAGLAVLLIVGGAATAGLMAVRIDDRVPVIVARTDLAAGQKITADDLAFTRVASEGLALVPADRSAEVIGQYAGQPIPAGRLIDRAMLSPSGLLRPGSAAVGVPLKNGHAPAYGVFSGDVVQVIRAVDGKPQILAARGVIGSVTQPVSSGFGSGGGDPIATVVVDQDQAAAVAAAAAADQIVLVLLERGGKVGDG